MITKKRYSHAGSLGVGCAEGKSEYEKDKQLHVALVFTAGVLDDKMWYWEKCGGQVSSA